MDNQCPVCNSSSSKLYYELQNEESTYWVKKCRGCEHYYSVGDLQINNAELYDDEVYKVIDNRGSIYSRIIDYEFGHVLKNIKRFRPNAKRLLDFGSGKGNFLFLARKHGFEVTGVETAGKRAEFAEQKFGLSIVKSLYTGGKISAEGYDVITIFHVLEHLPHPAELLSSLVTSNLNENGIVVLEVPNFSSLQAKIGGNKWMHLDIPRHLSHFTEDNFLKLASAGELTILKKEYFSMHLGIIGMCQSIMSLFGYKSNIIKDMKHNKVSVLLAVLLVLPLGLLAEIVSCMFRRGGVIRIYCQKAPGLKH